MDASPFVRASIKEPVEFPMTKAEVNRQITISVTDGTGRCTQAKAHHS